MTLRLAVAAVAGVLALGAGEDPRPPVVKEFKLEGHRLALPGEVVFEGNTAKLDEKKSEAALYCVADYLSAKGYVTLMRIEGHVAGPVATGEAAQGLSEERAVAVRDWLVKHGVGVKRVIAVGFGATKPAGAEGEAGNTRVEVHMAQLQGRNIGGLPANGGGKVAGEEGK